jgi:hypothetical protein
MGPTFVTTSFSSLSAVRVVNYSLMGPNTSVMGKPTEKNTP